MFWIQCFPLTEDCLMVMKEMDMSCMALQSERTAPKGACTGVKDSMIHRTAKLRVLVEEIPAKCSLGHTLFKEMNKKVESTYINRGLQWCWSEVIKAYPENRRGIVTITSESKQNAKYSIKHSQCGQRDSSVVKNTYCSCRGLYFNFQYPN